MVYIISVWSAKHSKTRSLTDAAQNAMATIITNNIVLYNEFYQSVDQTDATCFYYPTITQGSIIIPGQCDANIPVVQNFNIDNVRYYHYLFTILTIANKRFAQRNHILTHTLSICIC